MGYFAEIDENNVVKRIIVIDSSQYANELLGGTWVETFPSDKNKNYAGVGYIYEPTLQNFYFNNKNPNYILDFNDLKWKRQPPTYYSLFYGKKPRTLITEDDKVYKWNDDTKDWDEV
jgi:hypothetical protein